MAVAGLHKASGLHSYLVNKDRSTTRTSFIRKMWRDLENEGRVKENQRLQTRDGVIIGPESPCSSSLSMESEDTLSGSRVQWVGENECKRVRIVTEWIESSSQQGDTCQTTIGLDESTTPTGSQINGARSSIRRLYGRQALLDLLTKFVKERKREVDVLLENKFVSNFAHRHRIQSLLKGRFLRNQRYVEDEKPTSVPASELGFLRQTNAVSDIRKGFLTRLNNSCHAVQSDSDTISDNEVSNYDHIEQAAEVVQETPHEISEVFETTNLTSHRGSHNLPESPSSAGQMHDNNILQYEETEKLSFTVDHSRRIQSDPDTSSDDDMNSEHTEHVVGEEFETTNEHTGSDSGSDTSSDNDMKFDRTDEAEESHDDGEWYQETFEIGFQDLHEEEWYVNDNENENVVDPTESWLGGNNSYLEAALLSRNNTFYWPDDDDDDDDNNGSRVVELRELTNRRSVSNLLQSDFGARLDQLMQSYVSRQDQRLDENANDIDASPQTGQLIMDHDLHSAADSRFPDSHYDLATEHELINSLRIDMEILEQKMNDTQKMLEACMDMQIELQRSVQQELYSALNQSSICRDKSGSGTFEDNMWNYQSKSSPQNGHCFLCCDDGFESLPDRSAHMLHVCSKCAQKVNWSKLKEIVRQP